MKNSNVTEVTKENVGNAVSLSGVIVEDFTFSHEIYGEKFYTTKILIKRLSKSDDTVVLVVSDRLLNVKESLVGSCVEVEGQYRSYNKHFDEKKSRLLLSVFVRNIEIITEEENTNKNSIYLDGVICKEPVYRKTPLGREICDLLLAVNRSYGKSDYIPCICWGRNAKFASSFEVGDTCTIEGRIQSREYNKNLPDGTSERRTAYEVSITKLSLQEYDIEEDNEEV